MPKLRNPDRLREIERSLREKCLRRREPRFSVDPDGRLLKITNDNGSSFKIPMPRSDSVIIEGLAARKFAEAAESEIAEQHILKNTHYSLPPSGQKRPSFTESEDGRFLTITLDNGRSFVIRMPDGGSPLIEALATLKWGSSRK